MVALHSRWPPFVLQPRSVPEWCCGVLGTLAGAAVLRGTTCRELFVVRCGSIRFSKRGGGERTELAAVAHANEKAHRKSNFMELGDR